MNDPKIDFLHALLALDAYNRHDDDTLRNISDLNNRQLSADIGLIRFVQSSDVLEDNEEVLRGSLDSGFSASHYTLGDDTIIAYRGTDFASLNIFSDDFDINAAREFLADVGTGWLTSISVIDP